MKFRPSVQFVHFVKRTLCLNSCRFCLPFSVFLKHFAESHNFFDTWLARYFRLFKRRSSALQNICTINKYIHYGLLKNALHENAFAENGINLQITPTPVAKDLVAYKQFTSTQRRVRCSSFVLTFCPDGRDNGKHVSSFCEFFIIFRKKLTDCSTTPQPIRSKSFPVKYSPLTITPDANSNCSTDSDIKQTTKIPKCLTDYIF